MKAEERKNEEKGESKENSRVHKPIGFRWISSEVQIFHSLSNSQKNLLHWVLKLSGRTK